MVRKSALYFFPSTFNMELTIKVYASIRISGKKGSAEPGVWILQKKFVQIQEGGGD